MKLYVLVAFLLGCSVCVAQNLDKALLWKVSGNGLAHASYLYGTIHLTCDATLDAGVSKAMSETSQLYLELDMDDPSLQSEMMNFMVMEGGTKMTDLTSAENIKTVDEYLQKNLGMPLELMNQVKPVFVSMMFVAKLLDCEPQSVEANLVAISAAQGEEVFGLETVKEQMAALDAVPYETQMDELVKSAASDLANDREESRLLANLYKAKDIEGMLKAARESGNATTSKYESDLLSKRNAKWIPKIEAIAMQKPTFFGIGAAHLAGESGVIKLLRKKGYVVEAVR